MEDPPQLQHNRTLSAPEGGGGRPPSTEEGAYLQGFTPARTYLLLREFYGDLPHHNNGTHLAGVVPDDATCQSFWRRLSAQSASWYSTPPGKVGRRFNAVMAAEWLGVINWKRNYERPFVFGHVVLTKTLGARKSRETRVRINHRLDLWERGIHAGLVGDALAEGRDQEGRVERCVEEEEDRLARSFHSTVMSGKLQQAVRQATDREGGGVSSSGGRLQEDRATGCGCTPGETT